MEPRNDKASGKEGGRISLSRGGASLGRSFAQTADAHVSSKAHCRGLRQTARGNAHRIVPVECLGGTG